MNVNGVLVVPASLFYPDARTDQNERRLFYVATAGNTDFVPFSPGPGSRGLVSIAAAGRCV